MNYKTNYFLIESFTVVSIAAVSVAVVSIVVTEVSVIVESVASALFSDELQATTDKDIVKAKKPNLNRFFIMILFLDTCFVHFLIP